MGPANVVFDRLQLHSWCIPKPWTNSLPLELMFVLLGLSLWDLKTFTHYLSGLKFVWMMRINRSHFLSASSIANAAWWRDVHVGGGRACATFNLFPTKAPKHCGTSRRSLIISWTILRDVRGTLHWFHSRDLLYVLSVDSLLLQDISRRTFTTGR